MCDYFLSQAFALNMKAFTVRRLKSMNEARAYHASVFLDGYIYAMGGTRKRNFLNSVERYSLQRNEWTKVADMETKRIKPCATLLNNTIFVVGGCCSSSWDEFLVPNLNKWFHAANRNYLRAVNQMVELDGTLYTVGQFFGNDIGRVEKYFIKRNEWGLVSAFHPK